MLRALPAETAATAPAGVTRRLVAELPTEGFADFAGWAVEDAGLKDADALLAGLAGASLGRLPATVAVDRFGDQRLYRVPGGPLGGIAKADEDATPDLVLRDLRMSRLTQVDLGAESAPVLTLTTNGAGLTLTLECSGAAMQAAQAVALLNDFAGRMEQPLRHLL